MTRLITKRSLPTMLRCTGALAALLMFSGCQHKPTLPDGCYTKPESGRCRAAIERYYFDEQWQECRAFIWGGCDGVVPFESMKSCQDTCPSLADTLDADAALEQHEPVNPRATHQRETSPRTTTPTDTAETTEQ